MTAMDDPEARIEDLLGGPTTPVHEAVRGTPSR
jgi:hypothetical protein